MSLNAIKYNCLTKTDKYPTILIHGLLGSSNNFMSFVKKTKLLKIMDFYSIDLPNHGKSLKISQNFNLENLANHVAVFMEQNNIEKANLIGHSLGGKVAMFLALKNCEKVEKMVIEDISPVDKYEKDSSNFKYFIECFRKIDFGTIKNRKEADDILAKYIHSKLTRSFLLSNLMGPFKADPKWKWRTKFDPIYSNYPNNLNFTKAISELSQNSKFEKPVLFVKGENSDFIKPEHRPVIEKLFPEYRLKSIKNAGHWVHYSNLDQFCSTVDDFLAF